MRQLFISAIIFLLTFSGVRAQEFNCSVSVLTPQIEASDKSVFDALQTSLREFINTRHWTEHQFLTQERIECSITITVSERVSVDEFKANIQIQARRPVYKSSYSSTMFNHQDNDFLFRYVQDQTLDFDEGNITSNLTAVLGFYAYIMLGLDYDSYALDGGMPYFSKAQNIVNGAQRLAEKGWKAFESTRNRYWLAENLMNTDFKPVHECLYKYHRLGFDRLTDNITEGRAAITEGLNGLRKVYNDKPNSFLMQIFFNAKADEIINLYAQAQPEEKSPIVTLLSTIDPANALRYQQGIQSATGGIH